MPARRALLSALVGLAVLGLLGPAPAGATSPGAAGEIAFVRAGDIWAVAPDGSGARPLTDGPEIDAAPDWSPDGGTVAFDRATEAGRVLHVVPAGGGPAGPLRAGDSPTWSPSGAVLAFVDTLPAPCLPGLPACRPLFTVPAAGGPVAAVPSLPHAFAPDWSPRGDWIAYEFRRAGGGVHVHVTSPSGAAIDYGFLPGHDTGAPSWSPDGARLAFVASAGPGHPCATRQGACPEDPALGLTVMNADGSGRAVVVPGDAREPAWSPDGTRIAFVSARSGADEVWVVNADGSAPVQVTAGGGGQPDWRAVQPRPAPDLLTISPDSASAGGGSFTLTVRGSGFLPVSTVRWNGEDRPTTFVSAEELRAEIGAADVAAAGVAQVTVATGPPGGGVSASAPFTVTARGPRAAPAPLGIAPPAISGPREVGGVPACSTGAWAGHAALGWQWLRGGEPIPGASAATDAPTAADAGREIACRMTATGPGGAGVATSAAVVPAAAGAPGLPAASRAGLTATPEPRRRAGTAVRPPARVRAAARAPARVRAGSRIGIR